MFNLSISVKVIWLSITRLVLSLLVLLIHQFVAGMNNQFCLGVVMVMPLRFSSPQLLLLLLLLLQLLLWVHDGGSHLPGLGFVSGAVDRTPGSGLVDGVGLSHAVVFNRSST
jgi:hypothetical protein